MAIAALDDGITLIIAINQFFQRNSMQYFLPRLKLCRYDDTSDSAQWFSSNRRGQFFSLTPLSRMPGCLSQVIADDKIYTTVFDAVGSNWMEEGEEEKTFEYLMKYECIVYL